MGAGKWQKMVQRGPSSFGMVEPRSRLRKTERLGEGSLVESCRSSLVPTNSKNLENDRRQLWWFHSH